MEKNKQTERGQALIIIVLVLVGLLAAVGLAIDGGMAFLERRRMQNAADAAALSGTGELASAVCGDSGADDGAVHQAVIDYAQKNGVEDVVNKAWADYVDAGENVLGSVGDGVIPTGSTGVSVTVEIERSTYFLTLVGIDRGGAAAHALAMTGKPAAVGMSIWPFGVPWDLVGALGVGEGFTIGFGNCKTKPEECYINDDNGDLMAQHRGWMNLGYMWYRDETGFPRAVDPSGDANVLKGWMASGKAVDLYNGDYIHAKPGANTSVVGAGETPMNSGDPIFVPIYDSVPQYDQVPTTKPGPASQGGSYYYHIVGLAVLNVDGVRKSPEKEFDLSLAQPHVLNEGRLRPTSGEGYNQTNACQGGVQLVTLWR